MTRHIRTSVGAILPTFLGVAALCVGCTSEPGNGGAPVGFGPGSSSSAGQSGTGGGAAAVGGQGALDPSAPAVGVLRRLSPKQYERSVADVLGGPLGKLPAIEDSPAGDSLKAIGATITAVTPLGVELFETAAISAAKLLFADTARRDALIGCTATTWDEACATGFLERVGRQAFRRPFTADEKTRYLKLGLDEATDSKAFVGGVSAMLSAILQSPHFVYRVELGGDALVPGKNWAQFTPFETATRLSFLLWGSTPDAQLLASAEAGKLASPEGLQSEAQRLLDSPRLIDGLNDLVDDLLSLDSVYLMSKDASVFPNLTPTLRDAMREEILRLFQDVVTRDADMMELFDTNKTFVNQELGQLYGINVTGTSFVPATHPVESPRSGLLTTALLLSVQDKRQETSPTRRGAFVRRVLSCDTIPTPPPDVVTVIPPPPAGTVLSRKDLLKTHLTSPACAACHQLMDPVGLAFENFDAIGRFRTQDENGLAIDASGSFDGTDFAGPRELGKLLRTSEKARNCLVRRIYQFSVGHLENDFDQSQLMELDAAFAGSGQRFSPLLLGLVRSSGFLSVTPVRK